MSCNYNGQTFVNTLTPAPGATAADATYSVELSTGSAANLSLGDTLGDAYGVYEGWGFALEDSTLKFKHLA